MSGDRGPAGDGANGAGASDGDTVTDGSDASVVDRAAEATDYDVSEWLSLEPDEEVVWVGEPTTLRLVGTVVTGVLLIPFLIGIIVLLAAPF
jgi:hypothetical protein